MSIITHLEVKDAMQEGKQQVEHLENFVLSNSTHIHIFVDIFCNSVDISGLYLTIISSQGIVNSNSDSTKQNLVVDL